MDADLDTLATARYVKIDELLRQAPQLAPWRPTVGIAPKLSDAELVTLAVMQALLGFTSEARWLRHADRHLRHLFPSLPRQAGYNKRLRGAAGLLRHAIRAVATDTSLWTDDSWIVDSTPVECGRSRETTSVRRSRQRRPRGYRDRDLPTHPFSTGLQQPPWKTCGHGLTTRSHVPGDTMDRPELLSRLSHLRRAKVGTQRVPHKPLLLLWLFGRFANSGTTLMSYREAEEPVSRLINDFGPPVTSPSRARQRAAMPFVHQERELWDLRDGRGSELGVDISERRSWLVDHGAVGRLRPEVEQLLVVRC